MLQRIERFFSEKGQGIVEYALILAFVVGIAVVALSSSGEGSIGQKIQSLFTDTGNQIDTARQNVSGSGTGGGTSGGTDG